MKKAETAAAVIGSIAAVGCVVWGSLFIHTFRSIDHMFDKTPNKHFKRHGAPHAKI